jgi:hypothetical protein
VRLMTKFQNFCKRSHDFEGICSDGKEETNSIPMTMDRTSCRSEFRGRALAVHGPPRIPLFVLVPRTITFNLQISKSPAPLLAPLTTASHATAAFHSRKLFPTRHVELIQTPLHLTPIATTSPRRALRHPHVPRLYTNHHGRSQQGTRHRLSRLGPRGAPPVQRPSRAGAGGFWLLGAQ